MFPLLLAAYRKSRRFDAKRTERRRGYARVAAYCTVVGIGVLGLGFHNAKADAMQSGLDLGRELGPLVRALPGDVKQVSLNGQSLFIADTFFDESRKEIVDSYEAHCAAHPGEPFASLKKAADVQAAGDKRWGELAKLKSLRADGDRASMVFCFVRGDGTPPTIAEAFNAFERTKDLGALGRVRYAYVEERPTGKTRVLTLWTDHHFKMDHLANEGPGDVPGGEDFTDSPRPEDSRRLLTGKIEGTPYAVNVYESRLAPREVVERFDATMMGAGWASASPPVPGAESHGYLRGQVIYTVSASTEEGKTIVAVTRTDSAGDPIGRLD